MDIGRYSDSTGALMSREDKGVSTGPTREVRVNPYSVRAVYLEILAPTGKPMGSATGFVIRRPDRFFLITNRHVVTGKRQGSEQLLGPAVPKWVRAWPACTLPKVKGFAPLTIALEDEHDKALWLEHPKYSVNVDVVAIPLALHVDVVSATRMEWPPFGSNLSQSAPMGRMALDGVIDREVLCEVPLAPRRLIPALELFVLGFPVGWKPLVAAQSAYAVWSRGSVASEPELDWDDLPRFLIDSRTRQGQSGSPVFAFRNYAWRDAQGDIQLPTGPAVEGELVGIYSGRIHPESDLGYVWRAETVAEIIDAAHA